MSVNPTPQHFSLPFRFSQFSTGTRAFTVNQDSDDDVETSVELQLRIRPGQIEANPQLGTEDPTFLQQPIAPSGIFEIISLNDPRVEIQFLQSPDAADELINRVTAKITGGHGSG